MLILLALDTVTAAVQLQSIAHAGAVRGYPPIGFHPHLIAQFISGNVVLGDLVGGISLTQIGQSAWWSSSTFLPYLLAMPALLLAAWAAMRAPLEIRLLLLWGTLLVVALFASRQLGPGTMWISRPSYDAMRYRILPGLVWLCAMLYLACRSRGSVRWIAIGLLATAGLVGGPADWDYPPFTDYHFHSAAVRFDSSAPGTSMVFPINPGATPMILVKH
jgi:hypothetical protein